jgi:predicted RNase H-like HicB family nuclease
VVWPYLTLLAAAALWIFFSFFIGFASDLVADALAPVKNPRDPEEIVANRRVADAASLAPCASLKWAGGVRSHHYLLRSNAEELASGTRAWHSPGMKLTAVFEPAREGGYTCFVEEIPAAISQGETIEQAKANLLDALRLVLQCQRELAEKDLSPKAVREPLHLVEA